MNTSLFLLTSVRLPVQETLRLRLEELEIIRKHEPKLYTAAQNIFGDSYEYTRKYRKFQKMMKKKTKENTNA